MSSFRCLFLSNYQLNEHERSESVSHFRLSPMQIRVLSKLNTSRRNWWRDLYQYIQEILLEGTWIFVPVEFLLNFVENTVIILYTVDIPWVTHFLALKSCVTKRKCDTQGMSVRFLDIPGVTHFWRWKVVSLRKNVSLKVRQWGFVNFPEVTQFWEACFTHGMSRNLTDIPWVAHFPLMTQVFSAKKCVT